MRVMTGFRYSYCYSNIASMTIDNNNNVTKQCITKPVKRRQHTHSVQSSKGEYNNENTRYTIPSSDKRNNNNKNERNISRVDTDDEIIARTESRKKYLLLDFEVEDDKVKSEVHNVKTYVFTTEKLGKQQTIVSPAKLTIA